ncbi:hypothetical protein BKA70DRAFT_1450205 [Coprinopsis sp. MPI-PUGE-AT-0042]|nr:hypothetical protein BKA70DRAFT_1450205 [Coprinopsis sp. MPI-PUGE-AT-0042]
MLKDNAESPQAQQLPAWLEWLAMKGGVGLMQNQGLWVLLSTMSTRALRPCPQTQSLHSARSTPISQRRTRQPNYTLTGGGYSSRFGQESRYDICTPTVHAQIAHEFCRDPITSLPLTPFGVLGNLTSTAPLFISLAQLNIKPTPVLAVLSSWVEINPPPPIRPQPSRSGQRNARRNRSDSPTPWAGDDRVKTLSPQPLPPPPPHPRYQKHERSYQHQAGKAGDGAHIDEPWVALRTFTQDPRFGVAPPAWLPRYST